MHQCLAAVQATTDVARLLLTASGGPFRGWPAERLGAVTVADALAHPTWSMGPKITIDSSTLMNKGLEVIEAHELFGIGYDRIDVVVHPQSIVHSMVELRDGSTLAQLSNPDMRLPIGYALGWPDRAATPFGALDWTTAQSLTFEPPDRSVFRCIDLAYEAGRCGGSAPAWLSAANEVAVEAFLGNALPWGGIADVVAETMDGLGRRPGGPGRSGVGGRCRSQDPGPPGPGPTPRPRWRPVALSLMTTLTEKEAPAAEPPPEPDPAVEGNRSRVVQLVVALALITGVFIALGWGYLLLFIAILFAIVMLHEFGHFVTAKRAGMKVTEYFVGFGPRLWSVRRGETEYGVKAIPAGGYVRITGFTSSEEVPEEDEARAYRQQPFHQRIIVASAGSAMHFLIAFVLALILVLTFGQTTNNIKVASLDHWAGKTTPAALAGLRAGDTIVSVNGKSFASVTSLTDDIGQSVGKPVNIGVERDGKLIHLTATPESGRGIKVDNRPLANHGYLGFTIGGYATAPVSAIGSPGAALSTMWNITHQEVTGLGQTFSWSGLESIYHQVTNSKAAQSAVNNPGSAPRPVSIVGIANLGAQSEQAGLASVLILLIAINIVFGILNMLPMIPLDGGHVAVAVYEWIRTKTGQAYYRADITKLFPVAALFIAFLLVFVFAGIFLDITHPLQIPH